MLDEFFKETNKYADWSEWGVQVFVVVFCTLLLDFFLRRIINRIEAKASRTKNLWDDALLYSLKQPLSVLLWVIGITFAASIVDEATGAAIFSAIAPIRDLGIIAVVVWFLLRFISAAQVNVVKHRTENELEVDQTTVEAIGKLLRASVFITGGLVALQTMGISISGVLAFGGIGGIAVGFAAKDLLANFFGGLMIYMDRPFSVGDWIRSPDRNIEGTVEHIGWRQTRIRTFDKRPLYVPNSTFANISVENPSRMTHRRIYETIGIRYDDVQKMNAITQDVKQMLLNHPEIDTTQTMIVNFNAFAACSLDFFVYTFTKTTDWIEYHEVKHDVLLKISDIISAHGAEVAFPTSTLHVPDKIKIDSGNAVI